MRQLYRLLFTLVFAWALSGCGTDDATRSNTFLELTAISITSEHDGIANLTDNQFTATGHYSGALTRDITAEVAWGTSDPSILTVNAAGLATAAAPGPVTVTATAGEVSGTLPFAISNAGLAALTVSPAAQSAPVGVESSFRVSGTFDDGSTQNLDRLATWSSLDPAVASVSSDGVATGLAVGSAAIQAEWQGVTGDALLTVTEATLTQLAVTPADAGYPVGLIVPYILTGTYSDASTADLTAQAFWSSDNENRAVVDNSAGEKGKVEMLASGKTEIVASYTDALTGDWEASTGLTVNSTTLRKLLVFATVHDAGGGIVAEEVEIGSGETLEMFNDETAQLTSVGEYTDSEEYTVTTQALWSSADPTIISVSNSAGNEGVATPGNDTGKADITASFEDFEIAFTIDVKPR